LGKTFGVSVPRLEDNSLLRGEGRFVDDIRLESTLEAAFVRSPHAHAAIRSIDASAALAMEGVHAVYALADLLPHVTSHRLAVGLPSPAYRQIVDRPILADGEVVYVGEPVAVVIATSRYIAEDAANMVEVEFAPLPAVSSPRRALDPNAPRVHTDSPHNLVAEFSLAYGEIDAAFANAPRRKSQTFSLHRGGSHSMEGRGVLARYDAAEDRLTVWNSTQTPHTARRLICDTLGLEENQIRVITPDLGGGFGPKLVFYPEEVVISLAAKLLGRPVKWIEDRREHFISTTQERDQYWDVEIAYDDDAKVRGVRGTLLHEHGAYTARGVNVPYGSLSALPLAYEIPAYDMNVKLVLTNTVPVTPVRGAGQPQGVFVMERLLDLIAADLGLDRAEVRRRNLIAANKMPYTKPFVTRGGIQIVLDSGDYPQCQADALKAADWEGFPARQEAARKEGRFLGIGFANYVEGTGRGPFEPVTVRIAPSGKVMVASGAVAMGQSTRTMLAQIVAEQLDGDISNVSAVTGDTSAVTLGFGGFNSRQAVLAGTSAHAAAVKVREKLIKVASTLLETAEEDLEIENRSVRIKGSDSSVSFAKIVSAVSGTPGFRLPDHATPGMEFTEQVVIDPMTYSNGTAVAEVEVDIATGGVTVLNIVFGHDCGRPIHPQIVDGQVLGGIVHGLGNALFERMQFDDTGQPVTTTFADYLLMTASETPPMRLLHFTSPTNLNPLGVKGVGESGVLPIPAAVISAVENALSPFGVRINHAPISPAEVVDLIAQSQSAAN
jgi:aerobic carbon-monoxide dehydrogenase large subunit